MGDDLTLHTKSACSGCGPYLPSFAAGTLDDARERHVREHLARCAHCRQTLSVQGDPTALFLELRSEPLPEDFWTGFQTRLRARLEEQRPSVRYARFRYPRFAYLAPLAMVLVLGATLFVMRPGRLGKPGWWRPEGIRQPQSRVVGVPRPRQPLGLRPGRGTPGEAPGMAPLMEEIGSPGARVYRFMVGDGRDETPIYFVVDESIDI
jgi:putative zinc finger protein